MLFDVHLYVTVRVKVNSVEADDMHQAICRAESETDLHSLFPHRIFEGGRTESEYAEEVSYFLVDVVGDEKHTQTTAFDADKAKISSQVCSRTGRHIQSVGEECGSNLRTVLDGLDSNSTAVEAALPFVGLEMKGATPLQIVPVDAEAVAQRKAEVAELMQMIEEGAVDPEDVGCIVDDLLYDAKAGEGAAIKREGLERELEYLLEVSPFERVRHQVSEIVAECRRASR